MTATRRPPVSIDNLIRIQRMRDRAAELRDRSWERADDYTAQIEAFDAVLGFVNPPKPDPDPKP